MDRSLEDGARKGFLTGVRVTQALVNATYQTCPYSKATWGNIDVAINVV